MVIRLPWNKLSTYIGGSDVNQCNSFGRQHDPVILKKSGLNNHFKYGEKKAVHMNKSIASLSKIWEKIETWISMVKELVI